METEDGTQVFMPWVLNPDLTNKSAVARSAPATTGYDDRNNVEQVVIPAPTPGLYRIVVIHSGGLPGGPNARRSMGVGPDVRGYTAPAQDDLG